MAGSKYFFRADGGNMMKRTTHQAAAAAFSDEYPTPGTAHGPDAEGYASAAYVVAEGPAPTEAPAWVAGEDPEGPETLAGPPLPLRLWPATARSVNRARHEVEAALHRWGLGELADTAALVLSELMTNAVQHGRVGGRMVGTQAVRIADGVRIEVHDARDTRPRVRAARADDEHGRGLALVDIVTGHRWGVLDREGQGKLVWAEVTRYSPGLCHVGAPDGGPRGSAHEGRHEGAEAGPGTVPGSGSGGGAEAGGGRAGAGSGGAGAGGGRAEAGSGGAGAGGVGRAEAREHR
jgi:hypothetical protein